MIIYLTPPFAFRHTPKCGNERLRFLAGLALGSAFEFPLELRESFLWEQFLGKLFAVELVNVFRKIFRSGHHANQSNRIVREVQ